MPELTVHVHRERQESREESVPLVSVDLLDPWDPPDWLDPLASLDVRYEKHFYLETIDMICLPILFKYQ